jgi:predicted nucleic acid-binding protein
VILADTSAWVEFDRATGSAVDDRLAALISNDGPLAATEPVVMELVASARNDEHAVQLRRLLARFDLLRFDAVVDFDAAARIYRRCRGAGATPRIVDCMIAALAWRHGATLLTQDSNLHRVANVVGINLDSASLERPARQELFDAVTERGGAHLPSSPTAIIRAERDDRGSG